MADCDPVSNTTEPITETVNDVETVEAGIEVLYKLIKSIHDANEEMIDEIEDASDVLVKHFKYNAPPEISEDGSSCTFKLEVTPVADPAKTLVSEWRKELDLINIFDIFNLKIDYTGRTYDDLKRLNMEMFDGVERYNMFYDDDSKKGRVELKKFAKNFLTIQEHINEVLSLCEDQTDKSDEIEAILSDANTMMNEAIGIGCRYIPPMIQRISKAIPIVTKSMEKTLCEWLRIDSDKEWTPKYRATKDGFGAATFHSKCDGVAHLLIVIRSDKDYVFGGYTGGASIHSSSGYINSIDLQPFLFSLINPSGTLPLKCKLKNPTNALFGNQSCIAIFGAGHDLVICDNANVERGSKVDVGNTYATPQPGGSHMFTGAWEGWKVKEILAFQIPE